MLEPTMAHNIYKTEGYFIKSMTKYDMKEDDQVNFFFLK